jgi:hypothetical protein
MNPKLVDTLVNAVLYEGYILYPYRASAKKNRQRFTFGRVYPEAYAAEQNGAEPCSMQTECLVEGFPSAALEITVRFLHPMTRDVGELSVPMAEMPAANNPDFFHVVPELVVNGEHHASWQEAVERAVPISAVTLEELLGESREIPFEFHASRSLEPIRDPEGMIAGVIVRRQEAVRGFIELSAAPVDLAVTKIGVRVVNQTPAPHNGFDDDKDEIVMRTFASTHTILHVKDGAFLSLIDPPEAHAAAAATCRNLGTYPILVGDEAKQERDTLISSPIILYDYPKIAAASPGDLFDAGEIDEILTLRIMTMTDEEKREMRNVDAHARQILERTESLPSGDLLKMHGVMRSTAHAASSVADDLANEAFFNPPARQETVSIKGIVHRQGDFVRVRPKKCADAMDMAIAGRIAMIESIEQDAEDNTHLALVLEDDPGKDLGVARMPGHRFFYGTDEVEPLEGE